MAPAVHMKRYFFRRADEHTLALFEQVLYTRLFLTWENEEMWTNVYECLDHMNVDLSDPHDVVDDALVILDDILRELPVPLEEDPHFAPETAKILQKLTARLRNLYSHI